MWQSRVVAIRDLSWDVRHGRFAYKDEYEKFKLYLTIILLLGAVACRFILHYRYWGTVGCGGGHGGCGGGHGGVRKESSGRQAVVSPACA